MNHEIYVYAIWDFIPVMFTPVIVIIFTYLEINRFKSDIKKHDAAEKNSDCERQELEKYLSGFDYV